MRKVAKTAEEEYLQSLVKFQYGAEGIDILPETEKFSLVPVELKKKLEAGKKESEKIKKKESEDKAKREDIAAKAREFYGSGPNRFRSSFKHRYNPYSGLTNYSSGSFNNGMGSGSSLAVPGGLMSLTGPQSYGFVSRSDGNPGYTGSAGGYGNPGYGNPGHGNPGYGNPGYGNPGYGNPGYGNPGYLQSYSFAASGSGDREDIKERKKNSRCGRCGKFGHWHNDGICDPTDVARKLAQLKLQDPQLFAAAESSALQLAQLPAPPGTGPNLGI